MSIALNSISKWEARVLPSFKDYYNTNGKIAKNLTVSFSYLMYLYMTEYSKLQDDRAYLDFFSNGGNVSVALVAHGKIPMGHKIAFCDIAEGEFVIKYGQIIGRATQQIKNANGYIHII